VLQVGISSNERIVLLFEPLIEEEELAICCCEFVDYACYFLTD
jgi:hypothetical protein